MINPWNATLSQFDSLWSELNTLRNYVERALDQDLPAAVSPGLGSSFFAGNWPPINLSDEGSHLMLTAEVPGMAREDIKLTLTEDTLTLRGERAVNAPAGYTAQRQERMPVSFTRSITLPSRINMEAVRATVRDGVLTVTLDKAEQAKPRQISVTGAS
jgi:HSP20 family protein